MDPASFNIDIYRIEESEIYITTLNGASYEQPTNSDPSVNGCGWGISYEWSVPSELKSGAYRAYLSTLISDTQASTYLVFFVKSANPGINAKILAVGSVTTWEAYNEWGGKSLYGSPNGFEGRARKVSFNRPPRIYDFDQWERPFIEWFHKAKRLEMLSSDMELEFCTSIDLHADPDLINNYKLVLSIGHDEYWSWEMRDTIQNFTANNNGNVAFLSGNVSWWQVRFEGDEEGNPDRTMVCYKNYQEDKTANPGIPDSHITINWFEEVIDRPENLMTGVSYYWGTAKWGSFPVSYKVSLQRHWLLKGTRLKDRDSFGSALFNPSQTGFETDAADFVDIDRKFPIPTGKLAYDTTQFSAPKDLMILASANLTELGEEPGTWDGPSNHNGWGTIGIYRKRNGGFVFHGGNYNWAKDGIRIPYVSNNNWNEFCWLTKNVLDTLGRDFEPQSFNLLNADFEIWDGSSPVNWSKTGNGAVSLEPGYTGNYSACIDGANGETFLSQQYIPIRTSRNYRISCYAKPVTPSNSDSGPGGSGITIRLQTLDVNNNPILDIITASYPNSTSGWQLITATGMLSNTDDFMIQARVKLQVKAGISACFDNVVVEEL